VYHNSSTLEICCVNFRAYGVLAVPMVWLYSTGLALFRRAQILAYMDKSTCTYTRMRAAMLSLWLLWDFCVRWPHRERERERGTRRWPYNSQQQKQNEKDVWCDMKPQIYPLWSLWQGDRLKMHKTYIFICHVMALRYNTIAYWKACQETYLCFLAAIWSSDSVITMYSTV